MSTQSARAPVRYYYFAYGSNMSLKQMAERSPSSLLMGKGRIDGFRWQINERGVANIVESTRDFVEGLVYQIGVKDKRQLDRNEGVAHGFYDDERLFLRFTPLPTGGLKTFHVARELESNDQPNIQEREIRPGSANDDRQTTIRPSTRNHDHQSTVVGQNSSQMLASRHGGEEKTQMIRALVYVSRKYTSDGAIRQEYIGRMEKAIIDARKLGLSDRFLKYVDHHIHQVSRPEEPPETMRVPNNPSTRAQTVLQGQSCSSYDRMDIDQPSHDPYAGVNIIERRPDSLHEPTSRTVYRLIRDDDDEIPPQSRHETRTGESRRSPVH